MKIINMKTIWGGDRIMGNKYMRTIFCFTLILFIANILQAQDTLYTVDGSKLTVIIISKEEYLIRFKRFDNPDESVHVIRIEDVIKLVYENGSTSVFLKKYRNSENPERSPGYVEQNNKKYPVAELRSKDFGRNYISINGLRLIVGFVTLSYEHTSKSGMNSLRGDFSFGFALANNSNVIYPKKFSTGIDFFRYPRGQDRKTNFNGLSLEYGKFNYNNEYYEHKDGTYFTCVIQKGILFQPYEHFSFSFNIGVGFIVTGKTYYDTYYKLGPLLGPFILRGGLNVGYKF